MALALLIAYLVVTFIRPGEIDPALAAWQLMPVVSVAALVATAFRVLTGRCPSLGAPQLPLLAALFVWAGLSILANEGGSGQPAESLLAFLKASGVAFLLMSLNANSLGRLRVVVVTVVVLGLLTVGQGIAAYHFGFDRSLYVLGGSPSDDSNTLSMAPEELGSTPNPDAHPRIHGLGYVGDPNDFAGMLVALLPLLVALRRPGARLFNALLVWAPAAVLVYGIYLTRSRGGIVALAGVAALMMRRRVGSVLSAVLFGGALTTLVVLGFSSGRTMGVDQSAAGRIEAWSDGLQMFKSSPIWGVGFDMFTEHHIRVAHNSFVHCFAELGFVGYFLWLGLIVLTLDDLRTVRARSEAAMSDWQHADQELQEHDGDDAWSSNERAALATWAQAISVSVLGFLIGMLFLSRAYDPTLYVFLGLAVALTGAARQLGYGPRPRDPVAWSARIGGLAAASIVGFWLYIRLLYR